MMRRILLALDGSPHAQRALEEAVMIARRTGARIHVVHAGAYDVHIQAMLATSAHAIAKLGGAVAECVSMNGPAAAVILGVAEDVGADLIVIGARGSGQWTGRTLGSVAMSVVQRACCRVLVTR